MVLTKALAYSWDAEWFWISFLLQENGVPCRKPRWAASTPSFNSSEDLEGTARSKNCPIHDASFWNKTGKKEKKPKKKGNKTYCSCPSFEDETSSTTTESSNNDEDKVRFDTHL